MTGDRSLDEWRAAFRTEARRHKLPGAEIGDALAEIDAYCADLGAGPGETFGEPAEYAAALAHGHRPAGRTAGGARPLWLGALVAAGALVGVMALLTGVDAATGNRPGLVTRGQLLSVAAGLLGVALFAAVLLRPGRAVRGAVDWRFGLVAAVGIAVTAAPQFVWQQPVLRVSGWLLAGGGLVLLALAWWPLVSGRLRAAPVVEAAPGSAAGPVRSAGWLPRVVRWGLPVALLCVLLVAALLSTTG